MERELATYVHMSHTTGHRRNNWGKYGYKTADKAKRHQHKCHRMDVVYYQISSERLLQVKGSDGGFQITLKWSPARIIPLTTLPLHH